MLPTADSALSAPGPTLARGATTVFVCTSCRRDGDDTLPQRSGARLHAALEAAAGGRDDVRVVGIECLSVCRLPVTIGFSAAGKWTYVWGDFAPDSAAEILAAADLYAAAADGLIPWKSRPDALKKGVVARLPPLVTRLAAEEAGRS